MLQWSHDDDVRGFRLLVARIGVACAAVGWIALLVALVVVPCWGMVWHLLH